MPVLSVGVRASLSLSHARRTDARSAERVFYIPLIGSSPMRGSVLRVEQLLSASPHVPLGLPAQAGLGGGGAADLTRFPRIEAKAPMP